MNIALRRMSAMLADIRTRARRRLVRAVHVVAWSWLGSGSLPFVRRDIDAFNTGLLVLRRRINNEREATVNRDGQHSIFVEVITRPKQGGAEGQNCEASVVHTEIDCSRA